jgi:hypothetical protein
VCVAKTLTPWTPDNYRPITLLNSDYKILARMIANRLRPLLQDLLHPSQYCGRQGSYIYDTLATVWDTIAFAEATQKPICVLSLDFAEAFDTMSHTYLRRMLQ